MKKSVFPDFIVCLEDGKKLKMLKRHLQTSYGMTPEDYRTKWRLPRDYPMVAPNYASTRSSLAKQIGLGPQAGLEAVGRPANNAAARTACPRLERVGGDLAGNNGADAVVHHGQMEAYQVGHVTRNVKPHDLPSAIATSELVLVCEPLKHQAGPRWPVALAHDVGQPRYHERSPAGR